jgi:hypothetical protein
MFSLLQHIENLYVQDDGYHPAGRTAVVLWRNPALPQRSHGAGCRRHTGYRRGSVRHTDFLRNPEKNTR